MTHQQIDRSIDYIEFSVTDMAASKRFYSEAFGWEFTDYGPDYASFSDARIDGGLTVVDKVIAGGPLVVFYASELDDIQRRVVEAGGKIVKETFSFPGGRRFHFADPSGNQLAVWSDDEIRDN